MNSLTKETIDLLAIKDKDAYESMFRLYYPRLVYFAKEYVAYETAKELVQDCFVVFWEKNPTFSNEYQLRSYLYTLVKNSCLMKLRHIKVKDNFVNKMKASYLQNQLHQMALEQLDTSEVTFKEMESIIEHTMSALSPRCREIFSMSRNEGKKNREIAADLNISIKTVEAQITNALKIFRISLKDYLPLFIFFIYKLLFF